MSFITNEKEQNNYAVNVMLLLLLHFCTYFSLQTLQFSLVGAQEYSLSSGARYHIYATAFLITILKTNDQLISSGRGANFYSSEWADFVRGVGMGVGSGGQGSRGPPWIFKHGTNIVDRGLKVLFFGIFC